jgi:hypothetical protein
MDEERKKRYREEARVRMQRHRAKKKDILQKETYKDIQNRGELCCEEKAQDVRNLPQGDESQFESITPAPISMSCGDSDYNNSSSELNVSSCTISTPKGLEQELKNKTNKDRIKGYRNKSHRQKKTESCEQTRIRM